MAKPVFSPVVAIFLLLALLLGGCGMEQEPPLRIGTNLWPGYEPLYLARDLGYLDGTPVQLKEFPSASEVIRAFRNGTLEGAALTLDEVLLSLESGMDLALVLVFDISHGADVILGRPGITTLADLRGRSVGVEASALGAYLLSRALQLAGLQPTDVRMIPLPVDEHPRAWQEERIDALVTFEPVRGQLLNQGAVELFDSSQIPGEIVDVLVVRRDVLKARPERVQALLTAWFKALDYLQAEPADAANRIVRRLKISPQALQDALQGLRLPDQAENLALVGGPNPTLAASADRLHGLMLDLKLLKAPVAVNGLFVPPPPAP